MWCFPSRSAAFTLVEVMVALVILTLLLSAIAVPLAAVLDMRRQEETRRTLDEAREALLGFAGFARDAWPGERNRIRYAVFGGAVNGVANALTRDNGMQMATLAGLGAAPHFLIICSTAQAATASNCGTAANQLTRRAALVLLSLGPNAGATPPAGSDEARNLAGSVVFVYREASLAAGNEFDDILLWVPVHLVINRLLVAGRLP